MCPVAGIWQAMVATAGLDLEWETDLTAIQEKIISTVQLGKKKKIINKLNSKVSLGSVRPRSDRWITIKQVALWLLELSKTIYIYYFTETLIWFFSKH